MQSVVEVLTIAVWPSYKVVEDGRGKAIREALKLADITCTFSHACRTAIFVSSSSFISILILMSSFFWIISCDNL